jgi:hypothetical protein
MPFSSLAPKAVVPGSHDGWTAGSTRLDEDATSARDVLAPQSIRNGQPRVSFPRPGPYRSIAPRQDRHRPGPCRRGGIRRGRQGLDGAACPGQEPDRPRPVQGEPHGDLGRAVCLHRARPSAPPPSLAHQAAAGLGQSRAAPPMTGECFRPPMTRCSKRGSSRSPRTVGPFYPSN